MKKLCVLLFVFFLVTHAITTTAQNQKPKEPTLETIAKFQKIAGMPLLCTHPKPCLLDDYKVFYSEDKKMRGDYKEILNLIRSLPDPIIKNGFSLSSDYDELEPCNQLNLYKLSAEMYKFVKTLTPDEVGLLKRYKLELIFYGNIPATEKEVAAPLVDKVFDFLESNSGLFYDMIFSCPQLATDIGYANVLTGKEEDRTNTARAFAILLGGDREKRVNKIKELK